MHPDRQNPLWKLNKAGILLDALDATARAREEARRNARRPVRRQDRDLRALRLRRRLLLAGPAVLGVAALSWLLV